MSKPSHNLELPSEPQQSAAETLPAGSAPRRERGKNGLQRGRSRVSSTRKPSLLRTEEPSPEEPEEPSKAQDLRSRVGTRSGAPGDLGCTISSWTTHADRRSDARQQNKSKPTGKSARQLLFSEALHHRRPTSTITGPHSPPSPTQSTAMSDKEQSITMEKILQEITAVSRRIEGMDASLSSLTLETKSMRSNIAGFQTRVTGLEHRMGSLETQMITYRDRDQDLLCLRSKLTDLEDRSRRDNICLLGIPEHEEGTDMQAFLGSVLPKLTSLDFDPSLEFQRAHRVGPKRSDTSLRPRPIIDCLLRHNHTRQILQTARKQGPFRIGQHDIRIPADYSKDTNE
ncbi:hypothetical protein NDU88_009083 [Pleurodeles waltl]|uniref:Uncharacterized protein n=1 Tax=Pleurodeles waltl TaxID=8319 RepID=A0AAV7RV34_PLEWA|nr:hypothetical protein NDU88_009083 [Pleurodeles waltl]